MENRQKFKNITAMLMIMLGFAFVFIFFFYSVSAEDISLNSVNSTPLTLEQLQSQNSDLNRALQNAKNNAADAQTKSALYAEKIVNLQKQIDSINAEIRSYNKLINAKRDEISVLQKEIDRNSSTLENIVRAVYIQGESYFVDILFASKSFSEFLDRQAIVLNSAKYYTGLANDLSIKKTNLENNKISLEQTYLYLNETKEKFSVQQEDLTKSLKEQQTLLTELNGQQALLLDNINVNNDYIKKMDSSLTSYYKNSTVSKYVVSTAVSSSLTGLFAWPIPGFTEISSYWGDGRNHQGIDIAGASIYGAEVIAIASGMVIAANSDGSWGGGYGNYVIVDHGSSYASLCGHMSEVIVKEGEMVSRGQVIGYVGSTGDSTGPHCHFEIRVDGTRVNPLDYY